MSTVGAVVGAADTDAALLAWQQLQKLQQLQHQLQQQQLKQERKLREMREEQRRRRRRARDMSNSDDDDGSGCDENDDDDERNEWSASDDETDSDDRDAESDDDEDSHADTIGPAHPFTARAFYVGTPEAEAGLRRLRRAAAAASLPCVWDEAGSVAFCLTPGAIPSSTPSTTKTAPAA